MGNGGGGARRGKKFVRRQSVTKFSK